MQVSPCTLCYQDFYLWPERCGNRCTKAVIDLAYLGHHFPIFYMRWHIFGYHVSSMPYFRHQLPSIKYVNGITLAHAHGLHHSGWFSSQFCIVKPRVICIHADIPACSVGWWYDSFLSTNWDSGCKVPSGPLTQELPTTNISVSHVYN